MIHWVVRHDSTQDCVTHDPLRRGADDHDPSMVHRVVRHGPTQDYVTRDPLRHGADDHGLHA